MMEVLLVILLWLGVIQPDSTYTNAWIQEAAYNNNSTISAITADTSATSQLLQAYGITARSVGVVDVREE
jgi:hypothetical protein